MNVYSQSLGSETICIYIPSCSVFICRQNKKILLIFPEVIERQVNIQLFPEILKRGNASFIVCWCWGKRETKGASATTRNRLVMACIIFPCAELPAQSSPAYLQCLFHLRAIQSGTRRCSWCQNSTSWIAVLFSGLDVNSSVNYMFWMWNQVYP